MEVYIYGSDDEYILINRHDYEINHTDIDLIYDEDKSKYFYVVKKSSMGKIKEKSFQ